MNRPLLFAMALCALTACRPTPRQGVPSTCDASAASSVTLNLTDAETGEAIEGATPTYVSSTSDGAACESFGDGGYVCGWEEPGDFTITVSAPGYREEVVETFVDQDECHVITEVIDVALEPTPLDCIEIVGNPSLVVRVTGTGWSEYPMDDATVTYSLDGGNDVACEHDGGDEGRYVCGLGLSGSFEWTASADGHSTDSGTVVVEATQDGCDVITQTAQATLECLAC